MKIVKKVLNVLTSGPMIVFYSLIFGGMFCISVTKANTLIGLGWLIAMIVMLVASYKFSTLETKFLIEKVNAFENARDYVQKAQVALNQAYGYNENIAKKVKVYSQMLGSGVSVPTANAIITFAQHLKASDSIFLIKIDNTAQTWSFQVAGHSVHIKMAKWVLQASGEKCDKIASYDGVIWKPKDIYN